ncbi:MAG: N-acetyltransferase [Pseudomonadota bacterium]
MTFNIRPECERDRNAIWDVTRLAFVGKPYAGGDEQDVIDRLRAAGALSVSLVAEEGDDLIGQVSFSPAANSDTPGDWYALGPIAVHPDRQGEGIGGALIEAGIQAIAKRGASGCILTGDPGYYTRHGFVPAPEHCPPSEPAEYFLVRTIGEQTLVGRFAFHTAFYGDA